MKHQVREIGLKLNDTAITAVHVTPILNASEVKVVLDLTTYNKATGSSDLFLFLFLPSDLLKSKFLELKAKYSDFCPIYRDGSK